MVGSFEMMRTNMAHIGSSPIALANAAVSPRAEENVSRVRGGFEDYLLDAVSYVNDKQIASSDIAQQLIVDPESVDIHDVTIAMAEASMSLSIAQTVIDRVITSWNEITTTR